MESDKKLKKNRVVWMDILRIVATWGVISIHDRQWCRDYEIGTAESIQYALMGTTFIWCVPVFLMLSGALVLKKEVPIEQIIKRSIPKTMGLILLSYLWNASVAVVKWILLRGNIVEYLHESIEWAYGRDFFFVLAGLYLISPLLFEIRKSKVLEEYFLILSFLFSIILPLIGQKIGLIQRILDETRLIFVCGPTIFFVLGDYLYHYIELSKRNSLIFFLIMFFCNTIVSIASAGVFGGNKLISCFVLCWLSGEYYGGYVSLGGVAFSCSVFLLFKSWFSHKTYSEKCRNVIASLGKKCTIVFVIHGSLILNLVAVLPFYIFKTVIGGCLVVTSVYFFIAMTIAYIFSGLVKRFELLRKK